MRRLLYTSVILMSARVVSVAAQQTDTLVLRRQQRTIDSISAALAAVQARLDSLAAIPATPPTAAAPARASGAYMNIGFDGLVDAGWSSVNNPDLLLFQGGDHDPHVRGFTIPNAELT